MADGRIEFEIRANTDNLDDDLNDALDKALAGAEAVSAAMEPLRASILENAEIWMGALTETSQALSETGEDFKEHLGGVTDFIGNVFTGNWKSAWENIKSIFDGIWAGIGESFKAPINYLIDGINKFVGGINRIQIPDWVPNVGGRGFNIPELPRLKKGLDYVPADDYPALLHKGESVLTAEQAAVWRMFGGSGGLEGLAASPRAVNFSAERNYDQAGQPLFGKAADYFVVREEADIDKIAAKLQTRIQAAQRGRGGVNF